MHWAPAPTPPVLFFSPSSAAPDEIQPGGVIVVGNACGWCGVGGGVCVVVVQGLGVRARVTFQSLSFLAGQGRAAFNFIIVPRLDSHLLQTLCD